VQAITPRVALSYLFRQQELTQCDRPDVHVTPLRHSYEQFCKAQTSKKIKKIKFQRTFRAPVPGRSVMALLKMPPESNLQSVSLAYKVMIVTLAEPSYLGSMFSRKMSGFDFRAERFGSIRLHGPVQFKWELYLSEDGCGRTEGRLSVTVGGMAELNRFGNDVIKQSFEARARPAKRENPGPAIKQAPKSEKLARVVAAVAEGGGAGQLLRMSPNIPSVVTEARRRSHDTDFVKCIHLFRCA
jgi:hypothetical protein